MVDLTAKPWRIAENKWNLATMPFSNSVGIEALDETDVPAVVCWFTSGWDSYTAARYVIEMHNKRLEKEQP